MPDEPTAGLHVSGIGHRLAILDRLVDAGNTIVVIEHDLDVIRNADWIIDLGPGGGAGAGGWCSRGRPGSCWGRRTADERYLRPEAGANNYA